MLHNKQQVKQHCNSGVQYSEQKGVFAGGVRSGKVMCMLAVSGTAVCISIFPVTPELLECGSTAEREERVCARF